MTLRECLSIHKSSKQIYIEEHINDKESKPIALFKGDNVLEIIPSSYLDSEVNRWTYKLSIENAKEIVVIPVAVLNLNRKEV